MVKVMKTLVIAIIILFSEIAYCDSSDRDFFIQNRMSTFPQMYLCKEVTSLVNGGLRPPIRSIYDCEVFNSEGWKPNQWVKQVDLSESENNRLINQYKYCSKKTNSNFEYFGCMLKAGFNVVN